MVLHGGNTESGKAGRGNFARWSARGLNAYAGEEDESSLYITLEGQRSNIPSFEQLAEVRRINVASQSRWITHCSTFQACHMQTAAWPPFIDF